jgi:Na+-driven multidrug efflux pump
VSALGDARELTLVNLAGWASVGVAVPAAVFAARWGLVGVIYGVGLGWLLRALAAFYLTMRHLRFPAAVPVTAP